MKNDELKSDLELTDEVKYLRDIVDSYDTTDSKNIDFGMNKVDALNVLHNMIEHIPSFIYAKDTHHRFIMCNNAVARLVGAKKAKDLIGKTDLDFYPEETAAVFMAEEQRIMDTGVTLVSKDEPAVNPEGKTIWILTTKIPWRSQAGSIIGTIGIGQDITKTKELEWERDGVIKDLRSALASIKTLTGLLPICSECKKIRDDEGYWHRVEKYIHDNADVSFTHGICPDCAVGMYEEIDRIKKENASDE